MLDSLNVLLTGIAVVFFALILLTGLILLIPMTIKKRKAETPKDNAPAHPPVLPSPAPAAMELKAPAPKPADPADRADHSIIAVLTAAVMAYRSSCPELADKPFAVTSWRKVSGTSPVWNRVGRLVQSSGRIQGI